LYPSAFPFTSKKGIKKFNICAYFAGKFGELIVFIYVIHELDIIFNTELLICFIMQIFYVIKKANVTDGAH
jgi:hypothetical protein